MYLEELLDQRWLEGSIDSMDMSLSKHWEIVTVKETWCAAVHRATKSWINWVTKQQQHGNSTFNFLNKC